MIKKMKKFKLSEDVLATVISYIQNRPLREVEGLMNVLRQDIEFIGEEEVERPDTTPPLIKEENGSKEQPELEIVKSAPVKKSTKKKGKK